MIKPTISACSHTSSCDFCGVVGTYLVVPFFFPFFFSNQLFIYFAATTDEVNLICIDGFCTLSPYA